MNPGLPHSTGTPMNPVHGTPPGNPGPFANELQALAPAVAAELEDHLMESYAAGLRSGLGAEEARQAALRALGP
ncbi:MAG: permease prefix domain 1-containing protein, partial [Verrucomicrobiota bacterium]